MGAKDRKANEYFADNRRFADMCNAVLFGGRTSSCQKHLKQLTQRSCYRCLEWMEKKFHFRSGEIY